MSTILVTGATGFAGSHLVEALLAAGQTDVYGTSFGGGQSAVLPADRLISVDLTDKAATLDLIQNVHPDQIYHLAAFAFVGKSFERAEELLANNTRTQLNMLEAIREKAPAASLLSIGSAEEYGYSEAGELPITELHPLRPINPYAVSKVTQEMLSLAYAKSFGLRIIRVRPFNHIGERQSPDFAIPAFAKQIVEVERGQRQHLSVGKLDAVRDFTDVKDMVRGYILALNNGASGEVYNLGSGIGVKMETVVRELISLSGREIPLEFDLQRARPFDVPEIVADTSKVKQLGWNPAIPLHESLKRVIEYWRGL